MSQSLKQKTLSGMIWSAIQKFGTMLISFVANVVLARMLMPDDFGAVGMLMIFIVISNTFIDGGFGSALIQKKEPTEDDYSTIFWWNLLISTILYGLLFVTSPLIARYYHLEILTDLLRVEGFVLILNSLCIIQQNKLRKQLRFKQMANINMSAAAMSVCIAIGMAYAGFGVWALVAQQLLSSGLNALLYWIFGHWYPRLHFSRESFRELFGFGGFILVSNLINNFCNNVQGLIIGRYFSAGTMGLYSQAKKLEEIASTTIASIIDQVSYPVLVEVQNDRERLIWTQRQMTEAIAFVCFPIMVLLIVIAKPLILLLYKEQWLECVPYFQVLCVAGLAICLQSINYYAVAAAGKSRKLFVWTIIKRLLGLVLLIIGFALYGIYGLLWGMVAGAVCIYLINAALASSVVGYKLWRQLLDLLPILAVATMSGIAAWSLHLLPLHQYIEMILAIGVYALLYLILAQIFKLDSMKMATALLKQIINRK